MTSLKEAMKRAAVWSATLLLAAGAVLATQGIATATEIAESDKTVVQTSVEEETGEPVSPIPLPGLENTGAGDNPVVLIGLSIFAVVAIIGAAVVAPKLNERYMRKQQENS
jgi:hypothetical protein